MEYNIVFSNRKTVSLCIKEGKLIVRAPFGMSKKGVADIVDSHKSWVYRSIEKQRQRNSKYENLSDENIAELRKTAKMVLSSKVDKYAQIMGLKHGRITITSAKTRFGSCSSKGNLAFSYRLMLYPDEAVDYVVVHELAHLVEMNHSPAFYRIVESVLPDYKKRQMLLKK